MCKIFLINGKNRKRILCVSFIFFLITCNLINNSHSSHKQPSLVPNGSNLLNSFPDTNVVINLPDSLRVQSLYGINCPPDALSVTPDALTFSSDRLKYDSGEIRQMADYFNAAFNTAGTQSGYPYWAHGTEDETTQNLRVPGTLHLISGTPLGDVEQLGFDGGTCYATLEITNLGPDAAQILGIDAKLTSVPQFNNHHYRLIDACSLPIDVPKTSLSCPITSETSAIALSGTFDAPETLYNFQLNKGLAGSTFPSVQQDHGIITLRPGDIFIADLYFGSVNQPANFIYSLVPEIHVVTSTGQSVFPLQQLQSSLAFASVDQLSCYELQGHTFVLLNAATIKPIPDPAHDPSEYYGHWCL